MGKKKQGQSQEELEDLGWRRAERLYAWQQGGRGTQFQARIADLIQATADQTFIKQFVALAWTPYYTVRLARILEEARRDPGPAGFDHAVTEARETWNDIMGEPRNIGGRPKHDASNDVRIYAAYNKALAEAKRANPNVKIVDVQAAFVREHGMAKIRNLTEAIRRARLRSGPWVHYL